MIEDTTNKKGNNKNNGIKFLICVFIVVFALVCEFFVLLFELYIYQVNSISAFTLKHHIIHFTITILLWLIFSVGSVFLCYKLTSFNIFSKSLKIKWWEYISIIAIIAISFVISYFGWNGFKIVKEYNYLGITRFIFQYLYYLAESLLIVLAIIYSQNAFDSFFKTKYIPWGGIMLSLSWGLLHFISQGITTGILLMIHSLLFGSVYLLTNRNFLFSYLIIAFCFII